MIGAAVVPIWIIIVLLLLSNQRGLATASAFVAGSLVVRLVQGLIFGYVFSANAETDAEGGAGAVASTLLVVVGLLMLILAFKKWRKEEDPDGPPPKWMSALGGLTPLKALGMGALLITIGVKHWVFTLSALATIVEAELSRADSVILFIIYLLGAASLLLLPLIFYAIAPRQAGSALEKARKWLERNNRPITVAVSLIFGAYFLIKGITSLLG
jgi:hypothetical protein